MRDFTNFTEKIKTAGDAASTKAKEVSGSFKLRSEINNAEKQRENLILQLGKIVYSNQKKLSVKDPAYANLVNAITYFGNIAEKKNDELNEIQNGKNINEEEKTTPKDNEMICPNCGRNIPKGKHYCMFCGCDLVE